VASLLAILFAAAGQWLCPARFAPLPPRWVHGNLGAQPVTTTTDAWAHTRGFRNLNDIPSTGVYVWVLLSPRHPTSPAPPQRPVRLPLNLRHPDQIATQEASALPEYRFAGRYRGLYFVDVRIDFGRRHPTPSMRTGAQRVLTGLRLPTGFGSARQTCP
jgi:hypothetical protein